MALERPIRIAPTRRDLLRGTVAVVALIGIGVPTIGWPAHPRPSALRRPGILLRWGDPLLAMPDVGPVAHLDFVACLPAPSFSGEPGSSRGEI